MSWRASSFVRALRNVSRTEKVVLFVLAEYHNDKRSAAWPALPTLAADARISERHLTRVLQALEARLILRRTRRSDGRGSVTEYAFVDLPKKGDIQEVKRVTSAPGKGDICDAAIRKEPFLNLNTSKSPQPPSKGGLSSRDLRNLSKELDRIYGANVGNYGADFEERALRTACAKLLLPLDEARLAHDRSLGIERSHPQRVIGTSSLDTVPKRERAKVTEKILANSPNQIDFRSNHQHMCSCKLFDQPHSPVRHKELASDFDWPGE